MAITLLDELALEKDNLRAGVIQSLIEQVMIQDRIPWESSNALHQTITRLTEVPRVPLRMINEVPDQVQVKHAQSQETLYILETDIDIDPVLLMSKNTVQSLEVSQTKGTTEGIGYQLNDLFINADTSLDPREPQGLKARLRDDARFTGMTLNATANTTKLDFSPDAADADLLTGLYKMDELHFNILRAKASAYISNQQFLLNLSAGLRKLKLLETTRDQFNRRIVMWQDVPVLDVGYKPESAINGTPDATTVESAQIIGFDADRYDAGQDPGVGGGSNAYVNTNTIYGVVWGDDKLVGMQFKPLEVKAIGETQEPPHFFRTNFRWVMNPCVPLVQRCIARLVGFQLT